MPRIFKIFILFATIFNMRGWSDIPPDMDKYHNYIQVVYIDNLKDYPNYTLIMLNGADVFGYPQLNIIDDSGQLPFVPKWSDINLAIIKKSILNLVATPDELADNIYYILEVRGFQEFPIKSAYLYIDNKYPISRDEYHYKIVKIKDLNATLKLYKRVIELLNGKIITKRFR